MIVYVLNMNNAPSDKGENIYFDLEELFVNQNVMIEQIQHLLNLAEKRKVTFRFTVDIREAK